MGRRNCFSYPMLQWEHLPWSLPKSQSSHLPSGFLPRCTNELPAPCAPLRLNSGWDHPAPSEWWFLLPSQGSLAKPSAPAVPQARSDGQSSAGWPTRRQSKAAEQKQEKAGKKDTSHTKVWRKAEQGMLRSILLLMDHGGCSPIPLGTQPLSLLHPELQLGGCRRGLALGAVPFRIPKAGGCGQPLSQAKSPWLVCSKLLWSCGMSALNSRWNLWTPLKNPQQ